MPLKKLYSTYHITNSGELKTSQILELELSYHPGHWQLIHSFLRGKSRKDSAGECDFILIGEKGILVLEVKGSQWKLQDHRFSQKKGEEWISKESPFVQVRENKSALIDILHKNGIRDVLVANAVVFPECTFPLLDPPDPFWHLGMSEDVCLSLFLEEVLEEQFALQTETNGLRLNVLSRERMEQISKLLCPQVMPNEVLAHLLLSQDEAKRRASDNLRILDGLNENKRILIQGPPGSGKSSYALAMAARKSAEGYRKILYLCWNELLAAYNSYKLRELGIIGAEAWPFYPYVLSLMDRAGLDRMALPPEKLKEPGVLLKALHESLDYLESAGKKPVYDYIIIDEAQDLFNKGIDEVVNRLAAPKDGLINGSYIIFYDNTQAFRQSIDEERYRESLNWFREYAAIYQLYHRYRGTAGNGLYEFISDLDSRSIDPERKYGDDVIIRRWKDEAEALRLLDKTVNEVKNRAGWKPEDLVVLFSSNLVSGLSPRQRPLDEQMDLRPEYVRITPENLCSKLDGVKFTTALSYKGLERDVVILVMKELYDKKINTLYQLLIGASRARIRVYVLVGE